MQHFLFTISPKCHIQSSSNLHKVLWFLLYYTDTFTPQLYFYSLQEILQHLATLCFFVLHISASLARRAGWVENKQKTCFKGKKLK